MHVRASTGTECACERVSVRVCACAHVRALVRDILLSVGLAICTSPHLDLIAARFQEKPSCCSHMQVGTEQSLGTKPAASFPSVLKTGRVGAVPAAQETPSVGKSLLG